jgi:hypothetical protein
VPVRIRIHVQANGVACLDFDGLSVACGTLDGSISLLNFSGATRSAMRCSGE